MPRYLSLDWIQALRDEVARNSALQDLAGETAFAVTQVVTDGPEGDVTYHLRLADGEVVFDVGAADAEDVRFRENWETAVGVATGTINAQEAFITGRIVLTGSQEALMANGAVFAALDGVFASVHPTTQYE